MDESRHNIPVRGRSLLALKISLAAFFLYQGLDKFPERRLWVGIFDAIGFGQWFRYVTGIVEVAGAVMLVIPKLMTIGAGLLACAMAGALLVHLFVIGASPATLFVALLLALLVTIGWREFREGR